MMRMGRDREHPVWGPRAPRIPSDVGAVCSYDSFNGYFFILLPGGTPKCMCRKRRAAARAGTHTSRNVPSQRPTKKLDPSLRHCHRPMFRSPQRWRRWVVSERWCSSCDKTKDEMVQRMRHRFQQAPDRHETVWESLWQEQTTPWDLGRPTPLLPSELASSFGSVPPLSNRKRPFRILVPGCGAGYDLLSLAQWAGEGAVITGLDLSETSLRTRASQVVANGALPKQTCVELMCGDFLQEEQWESIASWGPPAPRHEEKSFDLIYDYTFFCALPPSLRPDWGRRMASLLTPSTGRLLTILFPVVSAHGGVPKGPPYAVTVEDYQQVLEPHGLGLDGPLRVHPDTVEARVGQELVGWWKWKAAE